MSNVFFIISLKGQSNEILDPHFFQNLNQPGPLTNELIYCIFVFGFIFADIFLFLCISPGYATPVSQSPRGIILHRVNLPGESCCAESISPVMIPRRVNLPGVSNCAECLRGMIPQGVSAKSSQLGPPRTCFTCIIFLAGTCWIFKKKFKMISIIS